MPLLAFERLQYMPPVEAEPMIQVMASGDFGLIRHLFLNFIFIGPIFPNETVLAT